MSELVCLQAEVPSQRKKGHDAPKPESWIILQASIETRKVEEKFPKKFGFRHLPKSGFGCKPQNKPHGIMEPSKAAQKVRKAPDFLSKSGAFMVAEAGLEPTTSGL